MIFFSYLAIKTLSNKAIFYNQSQVNQSYDNYIKVRDSLLGWKNNNSDNYGARIDNISINEICKKKIY